MQFFGWFEDNEFIYFAMEYAENGNLYELLEKGNILERDMKVIAKQLLAGLQVMHENDFCHRDIKPEVVFPHLVPTEQEAKPWYRTFLWSHCRPL